MVTALAWLPDGSGFISGGLDRKIILWVRFPATSPPVAESAFLIDASPLSSSGAFQQDADGKLRDTWGRTRIRVTDLMVTPDFTRLVAVGMYDMPPVQPGANPQDGGTPPGSGQAQGAGASANKSMSETQIIIYDLHTKQPETCVSLNGARRTRARDAHEICCVRITY